MILDELAERLGTYFHDGQLLAFSLDVSTRLATVDLMLWVSSDSPDATDNETLRSAQLVLVDVAYFVVESPDRDYPYGDAGPVMIDLAESDPDRGLPPTADGYFAARFFVCDWNSFIHFSARDATLQWVGPTGARSATTLPAEPPN